MISNIQGYLFDVAESGGGQARRLRARSFLIQLLAEAGALRVLRALRWSPDRSHFLMSGGGKFVLRGKGQEANDEVLTAEQRSISGWLLRETRGALRLTLAWADHTGSEAEAYRDALRMLLGAKARAGAPDPTEGWVPERLVLAPLDSPCGLCGSALNQGPDLGPLAEFSRALDDFFTARLKAEIESGREPRWRLIYTIFGGGDDLVMVGPWDVMIDFAGRLDELFRAEFAGRGLTLSAGLALTKPKCPIKAAVAEAERLLEQAKTSAAAGESGPKDQLAALGQVWKWRHHRAVVGAARRLVEWVADGQLERGWLHTLLELAEARLRQPPDRMATARLAPHVARNYRRGTAARAWADGLVQRFDDVNGVEVRYLPATLRYALVATRMPGNEE